MTNFKRIIRDLQRAGWSQLAIADKTGTTQTNISQLLRGREPRYFLGSRLVDLHERVTTDE